MSSNSEPPDKGGGVINTDIISGAVKMILEEQEFGEDFPMQNVDSDSTTNNLKVPESAENSKESENIVPSQNSSSYYQGVQGKPGVDFPVLRNIPKTSFSCRNTEAGYYADLETRCQVFHICEDGKKISFLCPNGTIFQQSDLICDWWFKVNCTNSPSLYEDSSEQLKEEILKRKAARRITVKIFNNKTTRTQEAEKNTRKHNPPYESEKSTTEESIYAISNSVPKYDKNPEFKFLPQTATTLKPDDNRYSKFEENDKPHRITLSNHENITSFHVDSDNEKINNEDHRITLSNHENTHSFHVNSVNERKNDEPHRITPSNHKNKHSFHFGSANEESEQKKVINFILSSEKTTAKSPNNIIYRQHHYGKDRNAKKLPSESYANSLKTSEDINENNFVNIYVSSKNKVLSTNGRNYDTNKKYPCKTCTENAFIHTTEKNELDSSSWKPRREQHANSSAEDLEETQIPQESASIVDSNNFNKIRGNGVSKSSINPYPNHKESYIEVADPESYMEKYTPKIIPVTSQYLTTQSFNNGKTFIGSTIGTRFSKNDVHKKEAEVIKQRDNVFSTVSFNTITATDDIRPFHIVVGTATPSLEEIYSTTPRSHLQNISWENRISQDTTTNYPLTEEPKNVENFNILHSTQQLTSNKYEFQSSTRKKLLHTRLNDASLSKSEPQSKISNKLKLSSFYSSTPASNILTEGSFIKSTTISTFPAGPPRPFELLSTKPSTYSDNIKELSGALDEIPLPYPFFKISTASPFSLSQNYEQKTGDLSHFGPTTYTEPSTYIPDIVNSLLDTSPDVIDDLQRNESTDILRPGLVVPSSVSPQTLHTLATYFENGLGDTKSDSGDKMKESNETETDNESVNIITEEKLRSLLRNMTRYEYENLFKKINHSREQNEMMASLERLNAQKELDLAEDHSKVRKLAGIFSQALSEYLNDPTNFKKTLLRIRPTEPPHNLNVINSEGELLDFSEDDLKSGVRSLYNSSAWSNSVTNETVNIEDNENDSLGSDRESLSSADSQSFVSQFNNLNYEEKQRALQNNNLPNDHWTTSLHATNLWRTTFAVNPGSLNNNFHATESYDAVSSTRDHELPKETSDVENSFPHSTEKEIKYELRTFPKISLDSSQLHGILIDFMNVSTSPESDRLHRILRKLNTTEDEFLDRMKKLEQNPLTRRLILLLIHECDQKRSENSNSLPLSVIHSEQQHNEKSLQYDREASPGSSENNGLSSQDQDTRALELLNSLYNIATKFGR